MSCGNEFRRICDDEINEVRAVYLLLFLLLPKHTSISHSKRKHSGPVRFSFLGLFRLVLAYFFSHGTIKSAEISRLLDVPTVSV